MIPVDLPNHRLFDAPKYGLRFAHKTWPEDQAGLIPKGKCFILTMGLFDLTHRKK